jgi:pectinesterase
LNEFIPESGSTTMKKLRVWIFIFVGAGIAVATPMQFSAKTSARQTSSGTAGVVRVVVSADGTADFPTIQRAVDHAPLEGNGRLEIAIRPGVYHERVKIPQDRPRVSLIGLGSDPTAVVITYSMSAAAADGTFFSAVVEVQSEGFQAANLTIQNSFGPGSQAVALMVYSDRAIVHDVRLLGWQDTLYAAAGRQYYNECYIEGAVDFIFGDAQAVFENSEIRSAGDGYIAAESRKTPDGPQGFVFNKCKLTQDVAGGKIAKGVFLGRPWRPYSRVIYLDCWMDKHIRAEGWDNWSDSANEKTAWFGEYNSTGPGANPGARVAWAHQLTEKDAVAFQTHKFLAGTDGWNPAK